MIWKFETNIPLLIIEKSYSKFWYDLLEKRRGCIYSQIKQQKLNYTYINLIAYTFIVYLEENDVEPLSNIHTG